jgi:hypothetical protein
MTPPNLETNLDSIKSDRDQQHHQLSTTSTMPRVQASTERLPVYPAVYMYQKLIWLGGEVVGTIFA